MGEFASKGVAGAGLDTGIAGLALGVLNGAGRLLGMMGNRGWPACNDAIKKTGKLYIDGLNYFADETDLERLYNLIKTA